MAILKTPWRKTGRCPWLGHLLGLLLFAAAICWLLLGLERISAASQAEGQRLFEQNLRRAVAACYTREGVYPPDLAYLQEHYGFVLDKANYAVHYEIFADNIMPEITVIRLDQGPS